MRASDCRVGSLACTPASTSKECLDCQVVPPIPDAWRYKVSDRTGRLGIRVLLQGEIVSLVRGFCLSVAAYEIVLADK